MSPKSVPTVNGIQEEQEKHMNVADYIKRNIEYEHIRSFFDISSIEDMRGNIMPIWLIVMIAFMGVLGFTVSGIENICEAILYFSMFPILLFLNVAIRKNTQKYSKFGKLYALLFIVALEYALVKMCSMGKVQYELLIGLNVLMWIFQTAFFVVIMIKTKKTNKRTKEKYLTGIHYIQWIIVMIGLLPIVLQRHQKVSYVNFKMLVPAVILMLSALVVNCVNSILFEIIYREEIAAELEKQREALEEKKANRRKLKRKK